MILNNAPWVQFALCSQCDPDSWFPDRGGSPREAKKVCADCPVRAECLKYSLDHDERFGVWGGLSEKERRKVKRGEPIDPPILRPCGTATAFQRHLANGETPCDECREAKNEYNKRWAQAKARQRFRARSLGETA